jgi:hypothetical protein
MGRTLIKLAASSLVAVGLIGVLHMPFARKLLQSVGGCPFPTTSRTLTAAEAEALRQDTLAPAKTLAPAPARPALGFVLEQTTRAEVNSWAASHQITCQGDRHGAGLTCQNVAASALPAPGATEVSGSLMLGFGANDTLVSVHYLSRDASRDRVLARSDEAVLLLASLSVPITHSGNPRLDAALSQSRSRLVFRDYTAELSATHMGSAYALSESYQAFAR